MNGWRVSAAGVALAAMMGSGASCTRSGEAGPRTLNATSQNYTVRGDYVLVGLDRVDALNVENGRVRLKGAPADLIVDLPPAADPQHPARHWALVTDAHIDHRRVLTFTESESVTDFSIELPDGDAPPHFDVFAARTGGEVLVFAMGDRQTGPPSLYGHVTITRSK